MKGNYSASPSFHPLNIRKAQIFSSQPLVLWDTKRLYFDRQGISIPWENKTIINCTYSKYYALLFLLCEDWKLYIFTENLQLITKITWDSKYTVCFKFIQQIQAFIMIGVSQVELLKVKIISNVKQTKFVSSMKCDIIKNEITIADQKTKLKWNKGYEVVPQQKLLYVWSLQDIIFYKLDTLEVIVKIQNITKKEIPLTKIFYNQFYKYIVIGYINGNIKIWKIPQKNSDKREIIHTFDYHTKAILDVLRTSDQRIFMSHGADYKIAFWNLDTFEMVYNYDFTGIYENIKIINSDYFYATRENQMGFCQFGKKLEFICNINNEAIYCDKFRETPNLFQECSPIESIQFTLNSNLGFNLQTVDLLKSDVNKVNIQFFYPPLKSKGITQIISCPFENNKYYLLVQNGQIYKTRIQANSGKIQNLYVIEKIIDQQSHQLNQQATLIKFLRILPPKYDSEIIAKVYTLQHNSYKNVSDAQLEKIYREKQLITIGCNKGAIIFLQRSNFQKIYTRITYHRAQIIQIDSIYSQQAKEFYLVSLCSEQLLKIVKFEDGKSLCLQTINCQHNLIDFKSSTNKLFCIFPKGVFEIFKADATEKLKMIENQDSFDHEETIICIDVDEIKKVVLTAALDKKIKIWNFYKVLIYQISLNQEMNQVILANDLNILIAHNKKLSLLRKNNFNISEAEILHWEKTFLQSTHEQYELSYYFLNLRGKKKLDDMVNKNNNNSISLNTTFRNSINKKRRNSAQKSIQKYKENSLIISQLKANMKFEQQTIPVQQQNINSNIHSPKQKHKKSSRKKFIDDFYRNKKKIEYEQSLKQDSEVLKKHMNDMTVLRKANIQCLPKIKNEKQSLFDEFMKAKLLNKKILTRRDITLNRIIMKNIIKQYIGGDIVQGLSGVKVDT